MLRCRLHLALEFLRNGFAFTVEETDQSANVIVVRIRGNLICARGRALIDRIEQAWPEKAAIRICFQDFQVAGPELKRALQMLNCFLELIDARKRPVQLDSIRFWLTRDVDSRILLAGGDHQIRKGLVIQEPGIESRLDVFDEPIFGQQSFDFALGLQRVKVDNTLEQAGLPVFEFG
jgi:hypothetical protein